MQRSRATFRRGISARVPSGCRAHTESRIKTTFTVARARSSALLGWLFPAFSPRRQSASDRFASRSLERMGLVAIEKHRRCHASANVGNVTRSRVECYRPIFSSRSSLADASANFYGSLWRHVQRRSVGLSRGRLSRIPSSLQKPARPRCTDRYESSVSSPPRSGTGAINALA